MRCFLRFQKSPFFGPSSDAVHKHRAVFPIKRKEVFTENESAGWYTTVRKPPECALSPATSVPTCPRSLEQLGHFPCPALGELPALSCPTAQLVDGAQPSEGTALGQGVCPGLKAGFAEAPMGRQTIHLPELSEGLPETGDGGSGAVENGPNPGEELL